MSWTVIIMHLPEGAQSFGEIPEDYTPPPLGTRTEIIERLKVHFPVVDTSNPEWLIVGSQESYDDFSLGDKDIVSLLTIRNPSEALLDFVTRETDWKILDAGLGTLVHWSDGKDQQEGDE